MAEKTKAEERRKKKEQAKIDRKRDAPSSKEPAYKLYRFDDWASI